MGQHFISILTMLHIVNKKRPRINFGAVICVLYVSAEAVRSVAKHTSGTQ